MTPLAPSTWSEEEVAWARDSAKHYDSLSEIAATSGRSIFDVAELLGPVPGRPAGATRRAHNEKRRRVEMLYRAGHTRKEIRAETRARPGMISQIIMLVDLHGRAACRAALTS